MVPEDATSGGWTTDTDTATDTTSELDSKSGLNIEGAILKAGGSARQGYGAWLWPVIDAPRGDWAKPRPPGKHDVKAVHVLTSDEVTVQEYEADPLDKDWTRPSIVTIQANRPGVSFASTRIHTSWLIYVPGAPVPPSSHAGRKNGYDASTLELYRQAICDYDSGGKSIAKLMQRLAYFWVQLKDGAAKATGEDAGEVYEALALLKESMTTAGLLVLTGEDKAGWSGPSLGGIKDSMTSLAERVAAVEGIPLTLMFGQTPGGLSTDGESGRKSYASLLQRWRRHVAGPALLELYALILGPDKSRRIVWPPSEVPTALEEAQTSLALAQRDQVLAQGVGSITSGESRGRLEGEDESSTPAIDEAAVVPEPEPEPEPARADVAAGKVFVSVPLSPAALERWKALRAKVVALLGDLEEPGGPKPHVTLFFGGEVSEDRLPKVVEAVREVAGDAVAFGWRAHRIASFEPKVPGRTPIIAQLRGWEFEELNVALMRGLMEWCSAGQHKRFEAHVTLGTLDRALTPEERGALLEIEPDLEGAAAAVDLSFGGSVVEVFPLPAVRADSEEG